jgi:hypothetical protein
VIPDSGILTIRIATLLGKENFMRKTRKLPTQDNPMLGDVAPEKQIYSLGFIAQMIQQPTHFVMKLARVAEVEPCQFINGVAHFRGDAVQRMAAVLQDERDKVEAAVNN